MIKGRTNEQNKSIDSPLDAEINSHHKFNKLELNYNVDKVGVLLD